MPVVTRRCAVLAMAMVVAVSLASVVADGKEPRLSRKIPPADPAVYKPRMANDWPNPRVMVDTEGIYLFEDGSTHPEHPVPVDKLAAAIVRLPLGRWPWGRIIALSLSPRMPVWKDGVSSATDPRFATLVRVRTILRSLGLEIVETPVGCHCQ